MTSHSSLGRGVFKYSDGDTVRTIEPRLNDECRFPGNGDVCLNCGMRTRYGGFDFYNYCDDCAVLIILAGKVWEKSLHKRIPPCPSCD